MTEKPSLLNGLVVIDLTRVLAGPYLTMMLADMGARVIKVEMPEVGDDARHFGPFVDGESAYFASINRGKESIALNLKMEDDREIFRKLVVKADMLIENYRAVTLEKLGFGWSELQKINSRLIYGAVSGFGHTGPYKDRPAYDMVVQGMGGIMSLTGTDPARPVRVGTSIGDITAGLFGLSGVLAALYDREKTGKGLKVDIGMLDCQVAILENAICRYFSESVVPGPLGLRHPSITPFAGLRASGDEYLIIAAGNNPLFATLCEVIGRAELIEDSRFGSNHSRTENSQALYQELEQALARKSVDEWLKLLERAGVPCGPINNVGQVVTDVQVLERNMIVTAKGGTGGEFKMAGNPIKFSGYDDAATRASVPNLDENRAAILRWIDQVTQS